MKSDKEVGARRWRLRQRTLDAHERLDALVGDWVSLADYRRYLSATYRFRAGIEQALLKAQPLASSGSWQWAELTPAIVSDMEALEISLPPVTTLDMAPESDALLGILYVLEGSSLGAQLLYRRALALGLSAEHGAAHLSILAHRLNDWRRFLGHLEAEPVTDEEAMVHGALAAFAAAEDAARQADESSR